MRSKKRHAGAWITVMTAGSALAACSLSGCGGGTGTANSAMDNGGLSVVAPAAPSTTVAPISPLARSVVFLGDSLTAEGSYPALVAARVGVRGVNAGVDGQTVGEMLARAGKYVIARHPVCCVLLCGTNDAIQLSAPSLFRSEVAALLDKLIAARIAVVVVTPPRFAPPSSALSPDLNARLAPLVAILKEEAAARSLTVADANSADVKLNKDGVHASAAGQATIAALVTDTVRATIGN